MKYASSSADSKIVYLDNARSFVDQIKIATTELHRRAETSGVVQDIIQKRVTKLTYTLYLRNLQLIYTTLEARPAKISKGSQRTAPLLNEMLRRGKPIEEDLKIICRSQNWRKLPVMESSKAYQKHIDDIKRDNPIALLGHIYVRYLGDLNGGQVLERLLKQCLNISDEAYNFYRYPAILNLPSFRADYRALFNLKGLSEGDERSIIDAAIAGFEFNIALSKDIKAFVRSQQ
jgi:heme oxygenase